MNEHICVYIWYDICFIDIWYIKELSGNYVIDVKGNIELLIPQQSWISSSEFKSAYASLLEKAIINTEKNIL